ncbi:unnamed protein product [Adineta steineri]|uniref:Rubicon Homology domain-containing protein n=1 Tax=Adineta steineri TaxID=433720 RepID=A0A814SNW8_9BILA|nr:unnamed protein product [Adineta steineri]
MADDKPNELSAQWPILLEARVQLLSGTLNRLSFLRRQKTETSSSSLSLSSLLKNINSTMQNCLSTCDPEIYAEKSTSQKISEPCPHCFESPNSTVKIEVFNTTRGRLSSEPLSVPLSVPHSSLKSQRQSDSSDYASMFGNGLSPSTDYWAVGLNDLSSSSSLTIDDSLNDQEQSICDITSTMDGYSEQQSDEEDIDADDFEVLSFRAPPESTLYIKEFTHTTPISQNNVCGCCNIPFSSISNSQPRRCHYFGKLYCDRCHIIDYAPIPAKIIETFDKRSYPVCRRAKYILQSNLYQPIIDIQHDNENLYTSQSILSDLKAARLQFQHLHAYLSTCPRIENEFNEKFLKDFFAREYLYQSVHSYSLGDFSSLKEILDILKHAIIHAKQHISQCILCREKGFTCEICKKRSDVLYPFDDSKTIGRCNQCSNIYHKQCWDNIEHDCPKCYRLIQRKYEQNKE